MEAGLIFVSTWDTFGCIIKSILKQPWNYIGFFVNTNEKGYYQTKVWIVDVFNASTPKWYTKNTLDDLLNHPLVQEVAIKKLKQITVNGVTDLELTAQSIENFKLSICSALNKHSSLNHKIAIYKLFGHKCEPCSAETGPNCKEASWCEQSANDLVNLVMKNFGIYDDLKIAAETKTKANIWEYIKDVPYAVFFHQFNQLNNNSHTLYSYLSENDHFENLEDLQIPEIKNRVENLKEHNLSYLHEVTNFTSVFFWLVNESEEFFLTVRKSIHVSTTEPLVKQLNHQVDKLAEITVGLINDASKSRKHTIERDVGTVFRDLNKTRDMLGKFRRLSI